MTKVIAWVKQNKLTVILLLIIGWLAFKGNTRVFFNSARLGSSVGMQKSYDMAAPEMAMERFGGAVSDKGVSLPPSPVDAAPPSDSPDRLVIRDTSLSMQVDNVEKSIQQIEQISTELGGFLVNTHLNVPFEAATGNITVRVPESKRQQALDRFKDLSVKVVSQSISGRDVTDQYEDINAKLATLQKTRAKFESILDQADKVSEILQIQREIISLQSQIDNLKGRQDFLEKSASLTRIIIYLSTDDLSLPYAPDEAWRPTVIFKQAIRSLVRNTRKLGTATIWLVVYSPVIIILGLAYWYWQRRKKQAPNV